MADSFDLNNQSRSADAVAPIPTSASEVEVRTMASDIEMMGKSGGMVNQGAPRGMEVPVTLHADTGSGISMPSATSASSDLPNSIAPIPSAAAANAAVAAGASQGGPSRSKMILITIIVIVAVLGLFALGFFVIGR